MKKNLKEKRVLLFLLGLFVITVSQVLSHFIELSDSFRGGLIGCGIALLLVFIVSKEFVSTHN